MKPKDFEWKEEDQVTVINPNDSEYRFKVHNKDYVISAHSKAQMPGYMAWVCVYGMASKAAQVEKEFEHWNEDDVRSKYYSRFVDSYKPVINEVLEEPANEDAISLDLPETTKPIAKKKSV